MRPGIEINKRYVTPQKQTLADQAKNRFNYIVDWLKGNLIQLQERAFVIAFSLFAVHFVYNLLFVDEEDRMSNEAIFWGLFVSTLLAFIAYLTLL